MVDAADILMAGQGSHGRSWTAFGPRARASAAYLPEFEESNRAMEQHFDFESAANSPATMPRLSPVGASPADAHLESAPQEIPFSSQPVSGPFIQSIPAGTLAYRDHRWHGQGGGRRRRPGLSSMDDVARAGPGMMDTIRIQTNGPWPMDDRSIPGSIQVSPMAPMMTRQPSSPTAYFSAIPPTPVPGLAAMDQASLGRYPIETYRWFDELEPTTDLKMLLPTTGPAPSAGLPPPPPLETRMAFDVGGTAVVPAGISTPPTLTIHPAHFKSRVETQVPIRLSLHPMPPGVTKLHLPSYTISKPKLMAIPPPAPSSDTLELVPTLVCASAMTRAHRLRRAFARAAGHPISVRHKSASASSSSSPTSSSSSPRESARMADEVGDEHASTNGEDVRICGRCIDRERKRAARKKNWSPEEQDIFNRGEHLRVIVFNTNEVKEWQSPAEVSDKEIQRTGPLPPMSPDAMLVHLPMRIACYCRHHSEKLGFRVIFTLKDHTGALVAQAITTSIMITDDHKTHPIPPSPTMAAPPLPSPLTMATTATTATAATAGGGGSGSPPLGSSSTHARSGQRPAAESRPTTSGPPPDMHTTMLEGDWTSTAAAGLGTHQPQHHHHHHHHHHSGPTRPPTPGAPSPFRSSYSSSDLTNLRGDGGGGGGGGGEMLPLQTPVSTPTRNGLPMRPAPWSSRHPSRQASPSGPTSASKRRKPSREVRVPSNLVMTRMDDPAAPSDRPREAVSSAPSSYGPPPPIAHIISPEYSSYPSGHARPAVHYSTGPPTPNRGFFNLESGSGYNAGAIVMPHQAFSAPTSAHHSRAPSPTSGFGPMGLSLQQPPTIARTVSNGIVGGVLPRSVETARIHRLVPAEGPRVGGTEVTCVGDGFRRGHEVMFGDVTAITTTYLNDQLLVCLAPPALQAGVVLVGFRHDRQPQQPATNMTAAAVASLHSPVTFLYLDDDDEQHLMRTALTVIGSRMMGAYLDPVDVARRILADDNITSTTIPTTTSTNAVAATNSHPWLDRGE